MKRIIAVWLVMMVLIGGMIGVVSTVDGAAEVKSESTGKTLSSHAPIYIDSNAGFNATNGVSAGSGTEADPYIIENWDINASQAMGDWPQAGIKIENTDVYFIIRNCTIHDGGNTYSGVYFYNVTNGKIDGVTSYNNSYGIQLGDWEGGRCNYNQISNCNVYYNSRCGIWLSCSSNNNITNCAVYNNSDYGGILLVSSSNNEIHYCNIYGNTDYGIYNYNTQGQYVTNATYNWWGSTTGPYNPYANLGGKGDGVSANVIYNPWLTAPWTGEVIYLHVTVTANPTSISSAETSTITITVTDGTNLFSGATINLVSNNGGGFSFITDNGDGTYTATFIAQSVTTQTVCRITATASKTGYTSGSGYVDVTVTSPEKEKPKGFIPGFETFLLLIVLIGCATVGIKRRKRKASPPPQPPSQ